MSGNQITGLNSDIVLTVILRKSLNLLLLVFTFVRWPDGDNKLVRLALPNM